MQQTITITLQGGQLSISLNELPKQSIYLLVEWPYVHQLMDYDWFQTECLPYQPHGEPPSVLATLVPFERYAETLQQGVSLLRI